MKLTAILRPWALLTALFAAGGVRAADLNALYTVPQVRSQAVQINDKGGKGLPELFIEYAFTTAPEQTPERTNFGAIGPAGAKAVPLKRYTQKFGGGFESETPAFDLAASPLSPAIVVKCDAPGLDLFIGLKNLPQYLAYSSEGSIKVRKLTETMTPPKMDQPWLLVWSGPAPGAKPDAKPKDAPLLIALQHPLKSIEVLKDRWRLAFADKTGTVVLLPLYGQLNPTTEVTAKWADGLPAEVLNQVNDWTKRLRRLPVNVTESFQATDDGMKITEAFEYLDIDDDWKSPKQPWALLPPIFALAEVMKGPIVVDAAVKDLPWLGTFGPLAVLDGKDQVSFTVKIPQLPNYVGKAPAFKQPEDNAKCALLRKQLRAEVAKVLEANDHLAPYRSPYKGYANYHWGNPAETILTLIWTLPYLEEAQAKALKQYIEKEYTGYDPLKVVFAPVTVGVRREQYEWDWESEKKKGGPLATAAAGVDPHNLYAVWEYADKIAGKDAAKDLWPRVKTYFTQFTSKPGFVWDGGESPALVSRRQLNGQIVNLNAHLDGYLAYTRFARQAGDKEAEQMGTCLLARGLAVKYAQAFYHQYLIERGLVRPGASMLTTGGLGSAVPEGFFRPNSKFRGTEFASCGPNGLYLNNLFRAQRTAHLFFLDLTPEVGQFLHDYCDEPVTISVRYLMWKVPGFWTNKGLRMYQQEEWDFVEPWTPWANFLALALAMHEPPEELYGFVGQSRAKLGDLYYLQELTLGLRAFALLDK